MREKILTSIAENFHVIKQIRAIDQITTLDTESDFIVLIIRSSPTCKDLVHIIIARDVCTTFAKFCSNRTKVKRCVAMFFERKITDHDSNIREDIFRISMVCDM
jgi:hypothetical protein